METISPHRNGKRQDIPGIQKAEDVLDVLVSSLRENGCQIRCSEAVENISNHRWIFSA
jgi:predicted flavoprotein YhiN